MAPSDEGTVSEEDTEVTNEIDITQPTLKQVLGAELRALALVGMDLKNKIASAKTQPKRKLYEKKLNKNSKKAAELILYLERLQIAQAIEDSQKEQEFIDIKDSENDHADGRVEEEGERAQN